MLGLILLIIVFNGGDPLENLNHLQTSRKFVKSL